MGKTLHNKFLGFSCICKQQCCVPRVTAVVSLGDQTESDAICKETSYGYVLSSLGYNNNYYVAMAADCWLSVSSDADKSQSRIVSINKAVSVITVECRLLNCQDVF